MAKTITVSSADGDLFRVAAAQYGDWSAWLAIAQANGLKNADITGVVTLVLPTYVASTMSGSLPGQS